MSSKCIHPCVDRTSTNLPLPSIIAEGEHISMKCGLWCLFGMLVFIVVEKLFATSDHEEETKDEQETKDKQRKQNGDAKRGSIKALEIEEIDKLLDLERKQRAKFGAKVEGAAGLPVANGDVTAKQLYESCMFNNNGLGESLHTFVWVGL